MSRGEQCDRDTAAALAGLGVHHARDVRSGFEVLAHRAPQRARAEAVHDFEPFAACGRGCVECCIEAVAGLIGA